ncbi:Ribonuclease PH [Streptomyces griseoloalbus]
MALVVLDCDVLQADGGTRTAAITGAYVALADAIGWAQGKKLVKPGRKPLTGTIAAVSVGIVAGVPLLDLCYEDIGRSRTESGTAGQMPKSLMILATWPVARTL